MTSLAEILPSPVTPGRTEPMVAVEDLIRTFGRGEGTVRALDGVTLDFHRATFAAGVAGFARGGDARARIAGR